MTEQQPKHVLCAVRGGPESRWTITRAIDLALEYGARLTFLRVMDAEFLEHATVGPLSVVYRELREVAKFALSILCERARRHGVSQVDYVAREGNIRRQLLQVALETPAEVMVLGRPTRGPGRNVFKPAHFDAFVAEIEQEAKLRVVVVGPDWKVPANRNDG